MKTGFLVSLSTTDWSDAYEVEAGKMANLITDIFTDTDKIASLTKKAEIAECTSEVEVKREEDRLMGRVVVEIEAEGRVTLDKSKLSQFVRSASPWKNCKVEKRALETDVLEQAHAATVAHLLV
jgi:uncharacterized membrane-anchored protein YjiN (DUF445 family)